MSSKAKQCTCAKYPELKQETHWYGGGRYKGQDRSVSWVARCKGKNCCQMAYKRRGVFETEQEAITAWNEAVTKDEERRDAPDKMIHDLEHSDDIVRQALARILKAVDSAAEYGPPPAGNPRGVFSDKPDIETTG